MNVPDAAVPAETPARRLAQMRSLAIEFTAELTDYRRNDTDERQALHLLTQPIYRYLSDDPELIDGAMFAFVLGTDPEIFLLLEDRRLQGANHWQYGLARMNDESLMVRHKEQEVWRLQRAKSRDVLRDPYVLIKVPEAP